jgi:hypothetical protein
MKLSRILFAFPCRITLILSLLAALPLLAFWGWIRWEVPPLQRYYLAAYWHSSETANQAGSQTEIRWLMETAPGRKRHWLFGPDVVDGGQNDFPLELSSFAVEQGWTGIERTPAQNMDSAELEKLLREDFYDGQPFRLLVHEPLICGFATWFLVAYLAFMMRHDIGGEWSKLRRVMKGSEWGSYPGTYWPENRDGIVTRIRSQIAHQISGQKIQLESMSFGSAISRRLGLRKFPNPESSRGSERPVSTQVHDKVSASHQLATPLPLNPQEPSTQRRTIFPGSSPSDAKDSRSKPWDESKWIE